MNYRDILEEIRLAFPQPIADPIYYNREIFQYVHSEAMAERGVVILMTDCYRYTTYGEPIVALKSFILSPFIDTRSVENVVSKVLEARDKMK